MDRVFKWLTLALIIVEIALVRLGILDLTTAVGVVVGVEALLLLLAGRQIVVAIRRYRRDRAAGLDIWTALEDGFAVLLPRRLARVVALEPKLWLCLGMWLLRRRPLGKNEFSYRQGSIVGPLLLAVVFTTPVEILLFELLIPWAWLRWVLLVLAIYALVWAFAFFASLSVLPFRLEPSGLRLHHGILADGFIPYASIERVETKTRRAPAIGDGFQLPRDENAAYFVVGGRTNVSLYLGLESRLNGFLGPVRPVTTVHLAIDEPDRFIRELEQRLGAEETKTAKTV